MAKRKPRKPSPNAIWIAGYRYKRRDSFGRRNGKWIVVDGYWRIPPPPPPSDEGPYNLCDDADRKALLEKIRADFNDLQKKASAKGKGFETRDINVVIDFRQLERDRVSLAGKDGEIKWSGVRVFRGADYFKAFLNFGNRNEKYPDWSIEGICQYEKRIYLAVTDQHRKKIGKIIKEYPIVPPEDLEETYDE